MRFVLIIGILLLMTANPALAQGGFGGHGYGWATNRSGGGGGGLTSPVGISDGGTGQTSKAAAFNALSPLTTLGDLLYGGASGAGTRLAGNTSTTRKYLGQTGTGSASQAPTFTQPNFNELLGSCDLLTQVTNALPVANGGTGLSSYTGGDTLYYSSGTTLSKLAKGTAGQIYQMNSGATAPQWSSVSGDVTMDVGGATTIKNDVALGGNPTTTTQSANNNSTRIATTAYVDAAVAGGGGGMTNPMTTTGDMIYSSSGSTPARIGVGAYDKVLRASSSGVPEYADRPVAPSVTTSELRTPWFAKVLSTNTFFSLYGAGNNTSGSATNQNSTDGSWIQFQSAGSINSEAGFGGGDASRFDAKLRFWARVKVVDTAVLRFYCGFQPAGILAASADTVSNACGFRYNPATDVNGNIRFYTTNGATPTVVDTGVPFAAGIYSFCVDASDPATYKGYIYTGGTLTSVSSSTNLPVSTTVCSPVVYQRTLENVAKSIKIGGMCGDSI